MKKFLDCQKELYELFNARKVSSIDALREQLSICDHLDSGAEKFFYSSQILLNFMSKLNIKFLRTKKINSVFKYNQH
mgnify:CR=1 FL=1